MQRYLILAVLGALFTACDDDEEGKPAGAAAAAGSSGTSGTSGKGGGSGASGASGAGGSSGASGTSGTGGSPGVGGGDAGGAIDAGPEAGGTAGAGDGSSSQEVTLTTFRADAQTNASFVSYRDGDGAWQLLTGGSGAYRFTPRTGRYTLLVVCSRNKAPMPGLSSNVSVLRALASEVSSITKSCSTSAVTPTYEVTISIDGLTTEQTVHGHLGRSSFIVLAATPSTVVDVAGGTHTLFLGHRGLGGMDEIIYDPAFSVFADETHTYDFTSIQGIVPTSAALTVTGAQTGEVVDTALSIHTSEGAQINVSVSSGTSTFPHPGLPAAQLQGNDVQAITATASNATTVSARQIMNFAPAFTAPLTLALPAAPPAPIVSSVSAPPRVKPAIESALQQLAQHYRFSAVQFAGDNSVVWIEDMTVGWLGSASKLNLEMSDPSNLSGWNDAYGFVPGTNIDWQLVATGTNRSILEAYNGILDPRTGRLRPGLAGLVMKSTSSNGTLLP